MKFIYTIKTLNMKPIGLINTYFFRSRKVDFLSVLKKLRSQSFNTESLLYSYKQQKRVGKLVG
jgi:hypothetical protein